jgi:hypothetical protein
MFDKVLILIWVLLGSILIIENMVSWLFWYLFLDTNANNWLIIFVAIIIWIGMWFWIKWILWSKKDLNEEEDDYNF